MIGDNPEVARDQYRDVAKNRFFSFSPLSRAEGANRYFTVFLSFSPPVGLRENETVRETGWTILKSQGDRTLVEMCGRKSEEQREEKPVGSKSRVSLSLFPRSVCLEFSS